MVINCLVQMSDLFSWPGKKQGREDSRPFIKERGAFVVLFVAGNIHQISIIDNLPIAAFSFTLIHL